MLYGTLKFRSMTLSEKGSKKAKFTGAPGDGGVKGYLFEIEAIGVLPVQFGVVAKEPHPLMSVKGVVKLGDPPTSPMPESIRANGGASRFWRVNSSSTLL